MKGKNVMVLNNASVIEAMQLWVNKHFTAMAPSVASVEVDRGNVSSALELSVTLMGDDNG